jgi:hypothetical protein
MFYLTLPKNDFFTTFVREPKKQSSKARGAAARFWEFYA